MIIQAIEEYSHGSVVFKTGGVDPDRLNQISFLILSDVARYCLQYDAYAVTNDSDFFVYKIPGVIDLDDLLSAYQNESRYNM